MLVERTMHPEVELAKWLLLMALAAALATLLFSSVAGATEVSPAPEPGRLPVAVESLAQPMPVAITQAEPADHLTPDEARRISGQLWLVVQQHNEHQPHLAQQTWQQMSLPAEVAEWRELGLAFTHLQLTEAEAAARALDRAEQLRPNNPIVYYLRGILHLELASVADEYYDAIGPTTTRLAGYSPTAPTLRQTKSMYTLLAMQDLERAIELRNQVFLPETLLPSYLLPAEEAAPTFGELLAAWNAENFVGQAHNMLGALQLERGWLEQAESHMDEAKDNGAQVLYGFRDLGARYEAQHRYGDAVRAYAKAIGADPSVAAPTQGMLRTMGRALGDVW